MSSKLENKNKKEKKRQHRKKEDDAGGSYDNNNRGVNTIKDPRFASVHSDPRFQNVPKHKSKVPIDSRFNRMFTDKSFATSSVPSDKRGKPKDKKNSKNPLRHYYQLDEEEEKSKEAIKDKEEEEVNESEHRELKKLPSLSSDSDLSGESERSSSEDDLHSDASQSTTDTDDDDDFDDDVYLGEDDDDEASEKNIPEIEKETHRLAVVNLDWGHVKAVDLYVVLKSFLPKDGQISSVSVYPSEFGLKRMEQEAVHGPLGLFDDEENEEDDDDDGNDEIDEEKLRAYEKSKLRYYFAVVECDSCATADYIYKACDGIEFEKSSNKLDLRFIPDSMEFKHPPRDVATEAPSNYEGSDFYTRALQHSKIELTWDEDEPHRAKTLKRKFNDDQLAELELMEFLASDESDSDENGDADADADADADDDGKKQNKREMYRALIQSSNGSDEEEDEEEGQEMEVTFNTGLEDISKRILEKKDKQSETVWQSYLRKKSEKKKARKHKSKDSSEDESSDTDQEAVEEPDDFFVEPSDERSKEEVKGKKGRGKTKKNKSELSEEMDKEAEASRAELELLFADDKGEKTGVKGYNLKQNKVKGKKGKKGKEVPDESNIPTVDYEDPRFSAVFTRPEFSLDPTDPQFKRSATYARQLAQRQLKGERGDLVEKEQRKLNTETRVSFDEPQKEHMELDGLPSKEKHGLSTIIKSLKMKSQQVQLPGKGKMSQKDEKKRKQELPAAVQSGKKKTKVSQK